MLTVGAQGVSALGVGVAKPPKTATDSVFLGVRVTGDELRNPHVVRQIAGMDATLVVDGQTAMHSGHRLATLAANGIDIGNGGWGQGHFLRWNRANDDCHKSAQLIAQTAGVKAHEFVPGRRLDGFDQIYCRTGKVKQRLVEANTTFRPEDTVTPEGRRVYLLDGRSRDPEAVAIALSDFETRARHGRPRRPTARGTALSAALAAGIGAGATTAAVAVVHAGPALAGVSPFGIRFTPRLVGRGTPGHVAITFDDGPDPESTPAFLARARRPGLARDLLHARHDGAPRARARRRGRGRRVTRSRSTATSTVNMLRRTPGGARDDIRRASDTLAELSGREPVWFRPPFGILSFGAVRGARRRRPDHGPLDDVGSRLAQGGDARDGRRRRACAATSTAGRCSCTTPTASPTPARGTPRSARCRCSRSASPTWS